MFTVINPTWVFTTAIKNIYVRILTFVVTLTIAAIHPLKKTIKLRKLSNSKKTGFIDQVKKDYAYLISMQSLQTNKSQVKKIFRNLQTVDVIPEKLYLENKNEIDNIAEKLVNKDFPDKIESIKAREKLNNLLVNTYSYVAKSENLVDNKNLNTLGYKILSKDFEYSSETGLNLKKNSENDKDQENIF